MRISVVIPAHEDQASLDATLLSFSKQTLPPFEIIVVDDGSDPSLEVPHHVRLIRIHRDPGYRGSSVAKNRGAKAAKGDWLAFSDDDILHKPDALESVDAYLERLHRDDVLVNVLSVADESKLPMGLMERIRQGKTVSSEQHLGVIKRDYFLSLGGYDEDAFKSWGYNNQDLSLRVLKRGGIVVSNVMSVHTGEVLYCVHGRPSMHPCESAKQDFKVKYGRPFDKDMIAKRTHATS